MDRVNIGGKWKEFLKKYRYVILVVFLGLLLMAIPNHKEEQEAPEETIPPVQSTEEALEDILRHISGAGDVKVLLTVAAGEETLYQTPGGLYFLYVNGGSDSVYPNEDILRLAKTKVNEWLDTH